MQIDIEARNFSHTKALRSQVERRMSVVLGAQSEHIQCVKYDYLILRAYVA